MQGVENGIFIQVLINRDPGGNYSELIRAVESCTSFDSWLETGSWKVDGNTMKVWTQVVRGYAVPDEADYHDSFVVSRIDADHVTTFDEKTKITWTQERAAADFALPPPPPCATS